LIKETALVVLDCLLLARIKSGVAVVILAYFYPSNVALVLLLVCKTIAYPLIKETALVVLDDQLLARIKSVARIKSGVTVVILASFYPSHVALLLALLLVLLLVLLLLLLLVVLAIELPGRRLILMPISFWQETSSSKHGSQLSGSIKKLRSKRVAWSPVRSIFFRSGCVFSLSRRVRKDSMNLSRHSTRRSHAKMCGAVSIVARQDGHKFGSAFPMRATCQRVGNWAVTFPKNDPSDGELPSEGSECPLAPPLLTTGR
jgi:hypothetical protein